MMKTRPARTVGRSVIASTTARSARTTQPTSSAESAAMLATWRVTVRTGREARAGGMMVLEPWTALVPRVGLAVEMSSIASTRYVSSPSHSLLVLYDGADTWIATDAGAWRRRRRCSCSHRGRTRIFWKWRLEAVAARPD